MYKKGLQAALGVGDITRRVKVAAHTMINCILKTLYHVVIARPSRGKARQGKAGQGRAGQGKARHKRDEHSGNGEATKGQTVATHQP
jgi:hypothetical protein